MRRRSFRKRSIDRKDWNFPPFRPEQLHTHVIRERTPQFPDFHPVRVLLLKDYKPWYVSIAVTVTESLRHERKLTKWWLAKKLRMGFDWTDPAFTREATFRFVGGSVDESTVTLYILCRPGMPQLLAAKKPIRLESIEVEKSFWTLRDYDYQAIEPSRPKNDIPF